MAGRLVWDQTGAKKYENGNDHGVLYVAAATAGYYVPGVAWNGITGFTESPDGAEPNDGYADNIKYFSIRSAETYGGTIEAYTYPDEFAQCDGSAKYAKIYIGQQKRKSFGFSIRTNIGNDVDDELGYKIHLVYGVTASPSEKGYETINDSPDAITFSWEFDTIPTAIGTIGGVEYKPTSCITIDSTNFVSTEEKALLNDFLDVIWGSEGNDALLPSPANVMKYFNGDLSKAELIASANP